MPVLVLVLLLAAACNGPSTSPSAGERPTRPTPEAVAPAEPVAPAHPSCPQQLPTGTTGEAGRYEQLVARCNDVADDLFSGLGLRRLAQAALLDGDLTPTELETLEFALADLRGREDCHPSYTLPNPTPPSPPSSFSAVLAKGEGGLAWIRLFGDIPDPRGDRLVVEVDGRTAQTWCPTTGNYRQLDVTIPVAVGSDEAKIRLLGPGSTHTLSVQRPNPPLLVLNSTDTPRQVRLVFEELQPLTPALEYTVTAGSKDIGIAPITTFDPGAGVLIDVPPGLPWTHLDIAVRDIETGWPVVSVSAPLP